VVGQPKPKERGRGAVLVVEDDPATREALVVFLRHEGYPAESVNDGQQALARLRDKKPPSLVLLDLMLPVMDGFEFRVQQLQDPQIAAIPVIVFSSGGDLGEKVARLRVDGCLTKPVDPEALLRCLATRFDPPAGAPQNA